MRALADEGFELLEAEGRYLLKYGDDILELGDLRQAAHELNKIFDRDTAAQSKPVLKEWIEAAAIALAQKALIDIGHWESLR